MINRTRATRVAKPPRHLGSTMQMQMQMHMHMQMHLVDCRLSPISVGTPLRRWHRQCQMPTWVRFHRDRESSNHLLPERFLRRAPSVPIAALQIPPMIWVATISVSAFPLPSTTRNNNKNKPCYRPAQKVQWQHGNTPLIQEHVESSVPRPKMIFLLTGKIEEAAVLSVPLPARYILAMTSKTSFEMFFWNFFVCIRIIL
mmetsp:Transcript_994/g.2127  ORF Transcript_994/g.2127 Transcript_994/m.2127 type:complete len:200 (-) Transcript_994:247-846(-)